MIKEREKIRKSLNEVNKLDSKSLQQWQEFLGWTCEKMAKNLGCSVRQYKRYIKEENIPEWLNARFQSEWNREKIVDKSLRLKRSHKREVLVLINALETALRAMKQSNSCIHSQAKLEAVLSLFEEK